MDLPHLVDNASHWPRGAWITLHVTHNPTAPTTMKRFISGRN